MQDRVAELLAALTLDEKVSLLAGIDLWHTPPIDRVGIPRLRMTDGPVGARGTDYSFGPPSACFPCGTALAATWDTALVELVGQELGAETRAKGAHVLLAPTVNMHRTPLAGRNFECYSEDPHLAGRMAVAYVRGVQSQGIASCIKHFVANDSEFERFTMSSEVPERALREVYLRPFEVAVAEAGPWAVMSAYNKVGGTWCSENPRLLTDILRREWGFDGAVVSDWWGTHSTAEAAAAGLDVEMPGPPVHRGEKLAAAVREGEVNEGDIDAAAGRLLTLMARTGALDAGPGEETADDRQGRRVIARRAAVSSIVLLKNEPVDGSLLLPLAVPATGTIAVVGPNADAATVLGGGSAAVSPYYVTTVLEAVRARAGTGATVEHAAGPQPSSVPAIDMRWLTDPDGSGEHALRVDYFDGAETDRPVATTLARRGRLVWQGAPPGLGDRWRARLRARLRVPVAGEHLLELRGTGRFLMTVDGAVVVDGRTDDAAGARRQAGTVALDAVDHDLIIDVEPPPAGSVRLVTLDLRCRPPVAGDPVAEATAAAARAHTAVVVVGHDGGWETEGRDRTSLALPPRQDELVAGVLAANPRTVVIVNTGSAVTMPWIDDAPSVVQVWFSGQEQGSAVADILFGDAEPGGRLPVTFPRRIEDTPSYTNYPGEFGRVLYGEGVFVGHRWYDTRDIEPLYPFGHGLSYTSFSYGPAAAGEDGGRWLVSVEVTNTGQRRGSEVVQVYVRPVASSFSRPERQLAGFAKIDLAPDEARTVTVALDDRAFDVWDPAAGGWRRDAGPYDVLVGSSSRAIRAEVAVLVAAGAHGE